MQNALLVMFKQNPHDHAQYLERLQELESIARATGYEVVDKIVQTKVKPSPKYLIGKGKVLEIAEEAQEKQADIIVFWNILNPRQKHDLGQALQILVIDRTQLILELFAQNASTPEAKLQIRLAQLKTQYPIQRYIALQKLRTDHPGLRASGEYAYHGKIKQLQKAIQRTEDKLQQIQKHKQEQIQTRKERGWIVALTGFYNTGKTTLFNAMTQGEQKTAPYPFTTLSSKVSKLNNTHRQIFLTDSIGLVQDMHELDEIITSFQLTFEDVRSADLVLCMVDISEGTSLIERKLKESLSLLEEKLDVSSERILIAFNKTDLLESQEAQNKLQELSLDGYDCTLISALESYKIDELQNTIVSKLLSIRS